VERERIESWLLLRVKRRSKCWLELQKLQFQNLLELQCQDYWLAVTAETSVSVTAGAAVAVTAGTAV